MNTTIRKIGNSVGIIIPKDILQSQKLAEGDTVVITADGDGLSLRKVEDDREEFERKMTIARERMKKYEVALRELAK